MAALAALGQSLRSCWLAIARTPFVKANPSLESVVLRPLFPTPPTYFLFAFNFVAFDLDPPLRVRTDFRTSTRGANGSGKENEE